MSASTHSAFVRTEVRSGVLTICLARAQKHNALDHQMVAALAAALVQAEADAGVHMVCLRSEGPTFCAGIDLKAAAAIEASGASAGRGDVDQLTGTILRLSRLSKPVLAVVQGPAFGAGLGLIVACDFVLATPTASVALTQVRNGLIPGLVAPLLAEAIGLRAARQLALSGERADATRALALGLFSEICQPEQIEARVADLILAIRRGAPGALAATKRLLLPEAQGALDDVRMKAIASSVAAHRASDEAREGMAAFRDRRLPAWAAKLEGE